MCIKISYNITTINCKGYRYCIVLKSHKKAYTQTNNIYNVTYVCKMTG